MKHFTKLAEVDVGMVRHALVVADLWPKDGPLFLRGEDGPTEFWEKVPQVRDLIFNLMRSCEATHLGTVAVEKTETAGSATYPGAAIIYEVVIQAMNGVTLEIGEETVTLAMGDVWRWKSETEAIRRNVSEDETISMLIVLGLA